jgi:hypothetical protein
MAKYQVVEKDDIGIDWAPVRYYDRALTRFETQQTAMKAAVDYITERNCNNALAAAEKLDASEVFMMTKKGVFLGVLDGKEWYMEYPKNGPPSKKKEDLGEPTYKKGEVVNDTKYFALAGKAQVAVRELPGS